MRRVSRNYAKGYHATHIGIQVPISNVLTNNSSGSLGLVIIVTVWRTVEFGPQSDNGLDGVRDWPHVLKCKVKAEFGFVGMSPAMRSHAVTFGLHPTDQISTVEDIAGVLPVDKKRRLDSAVSKLVQQSLGVDPRAVVKGEGNHAWCNATRNIHAVTWPAAANRRRSSGLGLALACRSRPSHAASIGIKWLAERPALAAQIAVFAPRAAALFAASSLATADRIRRSHSCGHGANIPAEKAPFGTNRFVELHAPFAAVRADVGILEALVAKRAASIDTARRLAASAGSCCGGVADGIEWKPCCVGFKIDSSLRRDGSMDRVFV